LRKAGGICVSQQVLDLVRGKVTLQLSTSTDDSSKWQVVDLQVDPAKPRRSQWMIYLDPTYEKTRAISIRRRTADGSPNNPWLEANANGTVSISKGAIPRRRPLAPSEITLT
jgi:hypothetical protein